MKIILIVIFVFSGLGVARNCAAQSSSTSTGCGNVKQDSVPVYLPQTIDAFPTNIDVEGVKSGDSVVATVTIYNHTSLTATFLSYRLHFAANHHWQILSSSPSAPFVIHAGDSVVFYFQYNAPRVDLLEYDNDTFYLTTCQEFAVAALLGSPKTAIYTQCYDWDILPAGGAANAQPDTVSSGDGVYVTSIGSDTLHVTNITMTGAVTPAEELFPSSDYTFGAFHHCDVHGKRREIQFPTADHPWLLAPSETVFVEVLAHPQNVGPRGGGLPSNSPDNYAYVYFENDAYHILMDSACLTMIGYTPLAVEDERKDAEESPSSNVLLPTYPNPFSTSTTLSYTIGAAGHVTLQICNVLGEVVQTLVDEVQVGGTHSASLGKRGLMGPIGTIYLRWEFIL